MTKEELKVRYREWAIKLHPDRNPDNPNAAEEFKEMQQQYEERLAELNGDYTKARKGRERREREERERQERERKEQERRKVERVIEQARQNRQKSHRELKAGDYIYAKSVDFSHSTLNWIEWKFVTTQQILNIVARQGVKEECVVMIEAIVELTDKDVMSCYLSTAMPDGIWGGYEILQSANPSAGVRKGKRVAKVVMFRSEHYCVFGNPNGDQFISAFYVPVGYEQMFSDTLLQIKQAIGYEQQEKARIEAEKKAKLQAEQTPLIEEWQDKLIELSQGLNAGERLTVAINNFKTMLKSKYPGVTFNVRKDRYNDVCIKWEDGPTLDDVYKVIDLFATWKMVDGKPTPWMECYGNIRFSLGNIERKMSTLTKARILQQLGQVTEAFRTSDMDDEIEISEFDWMMLHAMVGIDLNNPEREDGRVCLHTLHANGQRTVKTIWAVNYIFSHSSYSKKPKTSKVKK